MFVFLFFSKAQFQYKFGQFGGRIFYKQHIYTWNMVASNESQKPLFFSSWYVSVYDCPFYIELPNEIGSTTPEQYRNFITLWWSIVIYCKI